MTGFLCSHCGHENNEEDPYCLQCGAFRESGPAESPSPGKPAVNDPREETEGLASDVPQASMEVQNEEAPPKNTYPEEERVSQQPTLLNVLAGLIPERELSPFGRIWAPPRIKTETSNPSVLEDMKERFGMEIQSPSVQLTGRLSSESISRQWLLYGFIFLAALMPYWLGSTSLPVSPYSWEGTEEAWQTIQSLEPGSSVMVFWQNEPAVAGELDLPMTPVLTHLLAIPADLHLFSQHPLGLAQARELLGIVQRRQAVGLSDSSSPATVHEIGFWPGGFVVLPGLRPWLQDINPDLQILVTANAVDVIHWLELVAPLHSSPVIAITSTGIDQVIRPYQDSNQLAGVVRGYSGAQEYAQFNAHRFPNLQSKAFAHHAATQNWVSATMILCFLAALLLRHYAPLPWKNSDFDA